MPEPPPGGCATAAQAALDHDTEDCFPPDDNRVITAESVTDLVEDYARNGQLQAGIVGRHPTKPGKKLIAAGARRWMACKVSGRKFRAEFWDRVLTRSEIIRIRVGENSKRKNLNAYELCDDITAYKREMPPGSTWAQAGEELGISPSTMSRLLGPKRIPLDLRPATEGLGLTVIQIIGKLPTIDNMREAIAFAQGDGKPVSKEQVEAFCKRLKGSKAGRPVKLQDIQRPSGSVIARLSLRADGDVKAALEEAKYIQGVIEKHGSHGMEAVIAIMRNRVKGGLPIS